MQESNPRILVVDDDEVFCQLMQRGLSKREFDVKTAVSQQQAKQTAEAFQPEFALVDLRIGNDSGLEVIRDLVALLPDIRIVVLTGFASISTAIEAIKLGAIHYLTKPAELDEILPAFFHDEGNTELPIEARPMSPKRLEWEHLQKVLADHNGNISATARAMGMHRRTLQRKLAKKPVSQ